MPTVTGELINKCGPLMSIGDLVEVLRRTPNGLRFTLRGDSEVATRLREARVKIGRRVLFDTLLVGAYIEGRTGRGIVSLRQEAGVSGQVAPSYNAANEQHVGMETAPVLKKRR